MNSEFLIKNLAQGNKSFAITFKEDSGFHFYFHPDGCSKFVDLKNFNGFVFAPFDKNSLWPTLYLQPSIYFESETLEELLIFIKIGDQSTGEKESFEHFISSKEDHSNLINSAKNSFTEKFNKVVLSRIIKKELDFDILNEYKRLCENYPDNFNYIFYSKESGLWLGSSPEQLIKVNGKNGYTCALAGTKEINEEWTDKEIEEQKIVKNFVAATLENHAYNVEVNDEIIELSDIKHLKSNFSFKLDIDFDIEKIISELHPTPAIGGFPKKEALYFINYNEPHDRMFYSGYLGEVCKGDSFDLYVNLRCMNISNQHAYYFVGGGITASSEPEAEFEETQRKFNTLRNK